MILVLNCGSQSIKWKLFDKNLFVLKEGKRYIFNPNEFKKFLEKELKDIKKLNFKIQKIGHRVVHGGEKYRLPLEINEKNLKEVEKYNYLAPLHNPFNLLGIKTAQKIFPEIKQFAVFDTGFYKDLPEKAFLYPLPKEIIRKYQIRRFGFHGISHEYAAKKAAQKIKKPFQKLKIISCHLGGGASIAAIKNGKAIDTSMGFTPMEGLMMMTRSGDIDPGIVLKLVEVYSLKKASQILNKKSGLKSFSGEDNMLQVLEKVKKGDKKAKLGLEIFIYRIQKYIGAYFAVLGKCDLLVFTGAIGFGSAKIRNRICNPLKKNILKKTKIVQIKPNEELAIAEKIYNL